MTLSPTFSRLPADVRLGLVYAGLKRKAGAGAAEPWQAYEFRGAAQEIQAITDREFILAGPSETGKTVAALTKLHRESLAYPNGRSLILRKTQKSLRDSVLVTYQQKVLGPRSPVVVYGGETPEFFIYPNGSRVVCGGLDNSDKLLSSEWDRIYWNQAEEGTEAEWETVGTRATGRAGNMPTGLLYGDCNPAGAQHWIVQRARAGKLQMLKSFHQDNPALWQAGAWTEQGLKTIEKLSALSGARRRRLFEGEWASPAGVVYENFDASLGANLTLAEPDPDLPIELACDDGYVDPRVFLFIQKTPGRILVYDELWHSRHLAEMCVAEAAKRCADKFGWADADQTRPNRLPEIAVGPPEAKELQTRFRLANIPYRAAGGPNTIKPGIESLRRLICDSHGYRAFQVHSRCMNFISELTEGYQYQEEGKRRDDDLPLDANNHGCDAARYWVQLRAPR